MTTGKAYGGVVVNATGPFVMRPPERYLPLQEEGETVKVAIDFKKGRVWATNRKGHWVRIDSGNQKPGLKRKHYRRMALRIKNRR